MSLIVISLFRRSSSLDNCRIVLTPIMCGCSGRSGQPLWHESSSDWLWGGGLNAHKVELSNHIFRLPTAELRWGMVGCHVICLNKDCSYAFLVTIRMKLGPRLEAYRRSLRKPGINRNMCIPSQGRIGLKDSLGLKPSVLIWWLVFGECCINQFCMSQLGIALAEQKGCLLYCVRVRVCLHYPVVLLAGWFGIVFRLLQVLL